MAALVFACTGDVHAAPVAPPGSERQPSWRNLASRAYLGAVQLEYRARDAVVGQVNRLPAVVRKPLTAAFKLSFCTYVGAQHAVGAVTREQGFNSSKRARIAATTATVDVVLGAVIPVVAAAAGMGAVGATASSFIPAGSLGYLCYSAVRHPVATWSAARKGLRWMSESLTSAPAIAPPAAAAPDPAP